MTVPTKDDLETIILDALNNAWCVGHKQGVDERGKPFYRAVAYDLEAEAHRLAAHFQDREAELETQVRDLIDNSDELEGIIEELEAAQSGDGFKMIFEMRDKITAKKRLVENLKRELDSYCHMINMGNEDFINVQAERDAALAELVAAKAPKTVQQWCIFNHGCSQGCGTKDPVFFCGTAEQAETLSEEMTQAEDCYDSTWWIIAIPDAPPASPPEGGE